MKKVVLNTFTVYRYGKSYYSGLTSYDDAMNIVWFILNNAGFSEQEVRNTIINQYVASGHSMEDKLALYRYENNYFFKPNQFKTEIKAVRGGVIAEIPRLDEIDAKLIEPTRSFNGKGLRLNTIEPKSKFKLSEFHDKETWYALSVWRNKGLSTLGKPKSHISGGNAEYVASRLETLVNDGCITERSNPMLEELRHCYQSGVSAVEARRRVKPLFSGSARELRETISKVYG